MKIILLSGGSGKRLWPLSNDARSKQFLRLLTAPDGTRESMIQRVVRQIKSAGLTDDIVVATGVNQRDAIVNQLGDALSVVTEPCRRDTFPAIMLACAYLQSKDTPADEPVIVMPCDSFTDDAYFGVLGRMARAVDDGVADLVLMGIEPTYASAKYGYIVPDRDSVGPDGCMPVKRFTEKPDVAGAERLIAAGALWNGGVFAFRLGYLMDIAAEAAPGMDFAEIRRNYASMTKISFDYQVVEKATSVAVVPYSGNWKDLGTWNTLTDELDDPVHGNVLTDRCTNTFVVNELELPLVCIGTKNLVIAASPDGILVSERKLSENLKTLVDGIGKRPMYEERSWGEYKVVDSVDFSDGRQALTKQIFVNAGREIGLHYHDVRTEVWTVIDGNGVVTVDGETRQIGPGDVVRLLPGSVHGLKAVTDLYFVEVQTAEKLSDDDITFV